eukprot:CAMPEP_0113308292 /NCGR_PEP_ID=MMETSP0010_2-20120614/6788_1 /TAXON_ID=216773 ORGANISM="Corethron hystrix, Strain 308" /NCGR_SAMPLE_ID=MMETSP0010_2 /ASSEMBLY_ACC=CAM_ASM_000155 /LENGTH=203 /DNA_ID=CAMNT_0000163303 /DNA_START=71 /DNA_END=682 /DNA_ORIENTATION=- /assembly_acc=CAM_ASM_000155
MQLLSLLLLPSAVLSFAPSFGRPALTASPRAPATSLSAAAALSPKTVGTAIPDVTLYSVKDGFRKYTKVGLREFCAEKMVAILGVPGAFTPSCSKSHVPSFIEAKEELELWGVEEIVVVATNSPEIMLQWSEYIGGTSAGIKFLSDYKGDLSSSLGALMPDDVFDRMKRFTIIVDDNQIEQVFLADEDPADTYAPNVLATLKA